MSVAGIAGIGCDDSGTGVEFERLLVKDRDSEGGVEIEGGGGGGRKKKRV